MTNTQIFEKVEKCTQAVRAKTDFVPKVALTLGSGLGDYAKNIDIIAEVSYSEIEGFPVSTVPGHDGKFIFGYNLLNVVLELSNYYLTFCTHFRKNFKANLNKII